MSNRIDIYPFIFKKVTNNRGNKRFLECNYVVHIFTGTATVWRTCEFSRGR